MFKTACDTIILTSRWNPANFFERFHYHLSKEQRQFIARHWYDLDAVEITDGMCTIYKTMNQADKKSELTLDAALYDTLHHAKNLDLLVFVVLVRYHENWTFDTKKIPFKYIIRNPPIKEEETLLTEHQ